MALAIRGLVCVVCLYPLKAYSIVADPESLAVTLYQRVLCKGLVVCLLVISPKEVRWTTSVAHDLWVKMCNLSRAKTGILAVLTVMSGRDPPSD